LPDKLTPVFFSSILRDIRMERPKIRDTDNNRTFYVTRFFIEYLLLYREKQSKSEGEGEEEMLLGYAIVMAEMDSVRWVFSRLKWTMDETVSLTHC
jgi:replication fork protection complex subunit Tof1/Swi1